MSGISSQAGLASIRRGMPLSEPAHRTCGRVGKFDCDYDATIHLLILESGLSGEGDVTAPCAWFMEFTLDIADRADRARAEHYGTRWLIAREANDGRFWVETYDTEYQHAERLEQLRAAWDEWDLGVL